MFASCKQNDNLVAAKAAGKLNSLAVDFITISSDIVLNYQL
jgi:hypothetical protein